MSENSTFRTTYAHKCTVKTMISYNAVALSWNRLTKENDDNDVYFSSVKFSCSPYLAIKSALDLFGPIMTRCGLQMNLTPSKWSLLSH